MSIYDVPYEEMWAIVGKYKPLLEKHKLLGFKDGLWQVHLNTKDMKQFEIDMLEGLIQYGETQLKARLNELKGVPNITEEENPTVRELGKRESERKQIRNKIKKLMKEKGDELAECDREEAQELADAKDEFDVKHIKKRFEYMRTTLEKDMGEYRKMLLDT